MVKKLITATRYRVEVSVSKKVQIKRIELRAQMHPRLKGEPSLSFSQKVYNL